MAATSTASQSRTIAVAALILAAAALAVAIYAAALVRPPPAAPQPAASPPAGTAPTLAMAACKGSLAESPDEVFWKIPLDQCDKAIDSIDVKSGFVTQWSICGGAKSFEVTLNPRAVIVSSDAIHCSSTPSQVSVTFVGPLKK